MGTKKRGGKRAGGRRKADKASATPSRNKAAWAAARIREGILRGEYPAGQPLREEGLSQKLGISRIPLREALHLLAAERLVSLSPNRSAVVTAISEEELVEIAEACRLLECHALRLAGKELSGPILDEAEAILDELDGLDDPSAWAERNWRFHTTLYCAAGRPLQLELLNSLRARAERAMVLLVGSRERRRLLNAEHRTILGCLREKKLARAVTLLDQHLQGGKDEASRLIAGA